ncbi:MAG: hypothetical protein AAFV53_07940 [Myxococcota bacterium]
MPVGIGMIGLEFLRTVYETDRDRISPYEGYGVCQRVSLSAGYGGGPWRRGSDTESGEGGGEGYGDGFLDGAGVGGGLTTASDGSGFGGGISFGEVEQVAIIHHPVSVGVLPETIRPYGQWYAPLHPDVLDAFGMRDDPNASFPDEDTYFAARELSRSLIAEQ